MAPIAAGFRNTDLDWSKEARILLLLHDFERYCSLSMLQLCGWYLWILVCSTSRLGFLVFGLNVSEVLYCLVVQMSFCPCMETPTKCPRDIEGDWLWWGDLSGFHQHTESFKDMNQSIHAYLLEMDILSLEWRQIPGDALQYGHTCVFVVANFTEPRE